MTGMKETPKFIRDSPIDTELDWNEVHPKVIKCLRDTVGKREFPIILSGPPGSGKTCAMACMFRSWQRGTPKWWNAVEFIRNVQQARRDGSILLPGSSYEIGPNKFWQTRVVQPEVLFVDDVGLRTPSDSQYEILYELINAREGKPTFYSTNKTLKEIGTMFDERIRSRLAAGAWIEFNANDRRVQQGVRKKVNLK